MQHTLADGRRITLHLRRNAKKNIILRPDGGGSLRLGIPPWLTEAALRRWLAANEAALVRLLAHTPSHGTGTPASVWLHGIPHTLHTDTPGSGIQIAGGHIRLPEASWPQQKTLLREYCRSHAAGYLLPRLQRHAERLRLYPAAAALSNAKTFWGVCRRTGIRLNWRLIGAPECVADYVCVHELCHLAHAGHSPAFWSLVRQSTPHTDTAQAWLKRHGGELFVLD